MPNIPRIKDSILTRIWEELKHVNYQKLNEKAGMSFTIVTAGSRNEIEDMHCWLETHDYPLATKWMKDASIDAGIDHARMRRRLRSVVVDDAADIAQLASEDHVVLQQAGFCLAPPRLASLLAPHARILHIYEQGAGAVLAEEIIESHPELRFALSHSFPAFRNAHAHREIRETAMQNASWVLFTAAPNIVPNPAQLFTAPAEALSDFVVMTTNEIKLMFELVALTGRRVQPMRMLPELGIILGLAKLAQLTATNLTGKIPGAGLVIKGGVAYAFTSAIGEALYIYQIAGVRVGRDFIEARAQVWMEEGKQFAQRLLRRKKENSTPEDADNGR
ncbi:MAG: hypothetical protein KFH87_00600 [Bacteroidetes bacterium]|nr:hypothetical protein [Bacteroidota bacterium]